LISNVETAAKWLAMQCVRMLELFILYKRPSTIILDDGFSGRTECSCIKQRLKKIE